MCFPLKRDGLEENLSPHLEGILECVCTHSWSVCSHLRPRGEVANIVTVAEHKGRKI